MSGFRRFEDIEAWQQARRVMNSVKSACIAARSARDFGLVDQICRAARSTQNNIAEGFGRGSDAAFISFLDIARGSATETQSMLYEMLDSSYIERQKFDEMYADSEKLLSLIAGLERYLKTNFRKRQREKPDQKEEPGN
ncbi:hypothetical protein PLCT2_00201 [Planctomycetaceae bacterium]|nr:hypothetical protein PLCT2_00201 [Planctomycetaceae bacterium]